MGTYGEYINRMAWDMLCAKYSESKRRLGSIYGRSYCIVMQPRGYGKTMSTQALYRAITAKFARYYKVISVRWCTGFEILDNGKRRYCHVYMAEK